MRFPALKGLLAFAATLVAGLAAAEPARLSVSDARHFASRTGFGATPDELKRYAGLTRAEAVDLALGEIRAEPTAPMPAFARRWPYPTEIWTLGDTAEELFAVMRAGEIAHLRAWWIAEMTATPSPLTERLTLFWHDHFATRFTDVENSQWIARQHALIRAHAAGDFRALAAAMLRDPALLAFLSNVENVVDAPNENFAREWFELFTLGHGAGYDEHDVKAAARALTGHSVKERGAPTFFFDEDAHDHGVKRILGRSGRFQGDDLAALTLDHAAFGPYIVEKLWLEFVSDAPDPGEIARLTAIWKAADLELKPLLRALLLTDAFWDPAHRGRLVKSPVVLVVGTIRSLGLPVADYHRIAEAVGEMGQTLFDPPNVAGWPGGVAWITDAAAVTRTAALAEAEALRADFGHRADKGRAPRPSRGGALASGLARMFRAAPETAGPDDLRVGMVFLTEGELLEDGVVGARMTLFDLSFAGESWRSLIIEFAGGRGVAHGFRIYVGDCAGCLAGWPEAAGEAADWIDVAPGPAFEAARPRERRLIATLAASAPAFVARTKRHAIWRMALDDNEPRPDRGAVRRAAKALARHAERVLGVAPARVVFAPSAPGLLGLPEEARYDRARDVDARDVDALIERLEASVRRLKPPRSARPTYPTAAAWLAALPRAALASSTAERALLATPLPAAGRRRAMIESDPAALVRRLILSPHYQLH